MHFTPLVLQLVGFVLLVGGLALLCRVASRAPSWVAVVLVMAALVGMWIVIGHQFGTHVLFQFG